MVTRGSRSVEVRAVLEGTHPRFTPRGTGVCAALEGMRGGTGVRDGPVLAIEGMGGGTGVRDGAVLEGMRPIMTALC